MVSGVRTSEAVEGTLGLAASTKAMLSCKTAISLSASESLRPISGVKSSSTILNWIMISSLVAGLSTKTFLVPRVEILVFSS